LKKLLNIASSYKDELLKIYCILTTEIGNPSQSCKEKYEKFNYETIVKEDVIDNIILVPIIEKSCNENWNYKNIGDDWECQFKDGLFQSPIDLSTKDEAISSPVTPLFKFEEVKAKITETSK